ncbi:MAG TPA: sigma-70 region 4 domain-containing protein, partial [Ilumatobacteraceae bacterium]
HNVPVRAPGSDQAEPDEAATALIALAGTHAAAVYATACHLAAGNRALADELLVATFEQLRSNAAEAGPIAITDIRLVTHCLFGDPSRTWPLGPAQFALGQLDRAQRIALSLHDMEHRPLEEVAIALGTSPDSARSTLDQARASLAAAAPSSGLSALVAETELWLDDALRARIRDAIERPRQTPSPASPARAPAPAQRSRGLRRSHRSRAEIVAAGAAVAIIVVGAIWVSSPKDSPSDQFAQTIASLPDPNGPAAIPPTSPTLGAPDDRTSGATEDTLLLPISTWPGFVITKPPASYAPTGGHDETDFGPQSGWFELLATSGATRNTGQWLAIGADQSETEFGIKSGARRTSIAGLPAIITHSVDGIEQITRLTPSAPLTAPGDTSLAPEDIVPNEGELVISGNGFSADELAAIAADITLADGVPVFGQAAQALTASLSTLVAHSTSFVNSELQIFQAPGLATTYRRTDNGAGALEISVAASTPHDLDIARFVLPDPAQQPLDNVRINRTTVVGTSTHRHTVVVSAEPTGTPVLQWHDGTDTITLTGDAGLGEMLDAVASARQATTSEWNELLQLANRPLPTQQVGTTERQSFTDVGKVTTTAGDTWTLAVTPDAVTLRATVNLAGNGRISLWQDEEQSLVMPDQPLVQYDAMNATVILVAVRNPARATRLLITVHGAAPVTIPLVPVADGTLAESATNYAAAYAFSEVTTYTAQLIDANGDVVQQLTPAA